ncbi:12649_t:CDS:1, partial [Gigaspora rosea]
LCNNISGTVVAVKVNGTGEILGGYNPLIWKVGNNNSECVTTANSFIFSLKNENIPTLFVKNSHY